MNFARILGAWLGRKGRDCQELESPGIMAYYWSGGEPTPHRVRSLGAEQAVVETPDRWYPGTVLTMTLETANGSGASPGHNTAVRCRVCEQDKDAVRVSFVFLNSEERRSMRQFVDGIRSLNGTEAAGEVSATQPASEGVNRVGSEAGNSLIEFALILPMLFLLIVNTVNFGSFIYAWITVAAAARGAAQYSVLGGAAVGAPQPPTAAQIATVVTNDLSSLPNAASATVRVCTKFNTEAAVCTGTGSGTIPTDPEPGTYVLGSVDITYTYQPLIPAFSFPALSIYATLPPTTIRRQTVMRMLQ